MTDNKPWELTDKEYQKVIDHNLFDEIYEYRDSTMGKAYPTKLIRYLDEFCWEHNATGYTGGNNRTRYECPTCLNELREYFGVK
jgi:hypothetical protein